MTYEEFEAEINSLWENDEEKCAVILATDYPELYQQYCVDYGLIDEDDE